MKVVLVAAMALILGTASVLTRGAEPSRGSEAPTPVLVELFTSEGCSSCPPADRFLEKLDRQPVAGAEMIVLSEHVDYWNHIGWKGPYSAHFYSERQNSYAERFGLGSVYTPQMVVDGTTELVGSDSRLADKAFAEALRTPKIFLHLSSISLDGANTLRVHLETGTLEPSFGTRAAEVYIAIALNRAESQVSGGENAGHKLAHVSVVRSLARIGMLREGESFAHEIEVKLDHGTDSSNLRLIAFIQEPHQRRVLGATLQFINTR